MLRVDYKKPYGYYTLTQSNKKYKIQMCKANCLFAEMHFYLDAKTQEEMAQVHAFFVDMSHLKKSIKNQIYEDADNFVFHASELDTDMWKVIKELAKNGKMITIK